MTTLSNPFMVLIALAFVGHGVVSQAQSLPLQTCGELLLHHPLLATKYAVQFESF